MILMGILPFASLGIYFAAFFSSNARSGKVKYEDIASHGNLKPLDLSNPVRVSPLLLPSNNLSNREPPKRQRETWDLASKHIIPSLPIVNTSQIQVHRRCVQGVDNASRISFWKFNDEIVPGLHGAFAKDDILHLIFLVSDCRNNKQYMKQSRHWHCRFEECGADGAIPQPGSYEIDNHVCGSTGTLTCAIPPGCTAAWEASDPHRAQVQRVTVSAKRPDGIAFSYRSVEFCRYPKAAAAQIPGSGDAASAASAASAAAAGGQYRFELAACTMPKPSLGRHRKLAVEWVAHHLSQARDVRKT